MIVLRAEQAPTQESSFAVTQAGDRLQLSPMEATPVQNLNGPGAVLAGFDFVLTDAAGAAISFRAELTDTGLVIKVGPGGATELANSQRDLLVGTALLTAQRNKVATANQVNAVFIDLR